MNPILIAVLAVFLGGCAGLSERVIPPSWKTPVDPVVSKPYEVENPWEAGAIRNIRARTVESALPEPWFRKEFPVVGVVDPRSKVKEESPVQRVSSRTQSFCANQWWRTMAVAMGDHYSVQVPSACKEGDVALILSGNGRDVLTLRGQIVENPGTERIFTDPEFRERFFRSHDSAIRGIQPEDLPNEVFEHLNEVIATDGGTYRIGSEAHLAAAIIPGKTAGERFDLCGGRNISLVGLAVSPGTAVIQPAIGAACGLIGLPGGPKGLFLPDDPVFFAEPGSE